MPRKPRFQLPGYPQHVVQRGNNRQACFLAEQDYHYYLDALGDACEKYACQLHAYVLMTNHVHLLFTPGQEWGIFQLMQSVGRKYVRHINKEYRRTVTLWEGRYKAGLIQSERYLLACYRYIELNPVRASMVDHPAQYEWSSYRCNAQGEENTLITPHSEYVSLANEAEHRVNAYRELFRYQLDPGMVDEMRKALDHELVAGNSRFKEQIVAMTGRRVALSREGRRRTTLARVY